VEGQRVDGPEVALDAPKLLLENLHNDVMQTAQTMWKNRASNFPALPWVVVTDIASCPPPSTTWSFSGDMAAEFTGLSVKYCFNTVKLSVSNS
jgi:hypothetical protein